MADVEVVSAEPKIELKENLPDLVIPAVEVEEDELFKMRAKLYRWASEADPPQWKERGTGDVQLLQHQKTSLIRLVMRRDKTFKVCANHYVDPDITLKPHGGSEKAFVWNTWGDMAYGDEEPQKQMFAIRFRNEESANSFKDKFIESQDVVSKLKKVSKEEDKENQSAIVEEINEEINKLTVKEKSGDAEKADEKEPDSSDATSVQKEEPSTTNGAVSPEPKTGDSCITDNDSKVSSTDNKEQNDANEESCAK